jgi:hypothetical protein
MNKLRSHAAFNPEKFLAADAKKNGAGVFTTKSMPLRPVIQLTVEFKRGIYQQLEQKRPGLFRDDADFKMYFEASVFVEDFLRKALARERLKVREEVFRVLYLDFLGGLPARLFKNA